ncbi:hypothetical protein Hanom_Chr06g00533371 [Helianthus anomalus]
MIIKFLSLLSHSYFLDNYFIYTREILSSVIIGIRSVLIRFITLSILNKVLKRIPFEATSADQQQAIPNERNEYQIHSYALQDDETFNKLFFENTMAKHVSFHKPTEPINVNQPNEPIDAYQHTKPAIANQPTKTVHANQSTEPILDCQHTKPIIASKPSREKTKVSKKKTKLLELFEMKVHASKHIWISAKSGTLI